MDLKLLTQSLKKNVCNTCLSRNRGLYLASDVPEMKRLFPNIKFGNFDKICWECKAMAKKCMAFKKRAYKAQKLLHDMVKMEELNNIPSLSLLKSAGPYTTSYGDLVLELPILTVKTDPLISVKREPEEANLTLDIHEIPLGEDNMTIVKEERIDVEFDLIDNEEWKGTEDISTNILEETKHNVVGDIPAIEAEDCISSNKTHFNIWDNIILTNKPISNPSTSEKNTSNNEDECKIKIDISDINIGSNICEANNVTNIDIATTENHELNLNRKEKRFIIRKMTEDEMYNTREFDRNVPRYKSYTYKCDSCITGYYIEDKYKKHMEEKHSEKVGHHNCPICEVNFPSLEVFTQHYECHFRSYKCKQCDFANHKLSTMLIHMTKEHDREKKYTCKICGMVFDLPRSLRYHRDTTHKKLPKCYICNKTFTTRYSLNVHNLSLHRSSSQTVMSSPTSDEQCVAGGALALRLQQGAPADGTDGQHLSTQPSHKAEGALKFPCTQCEEKFMYKPSLQRHISSQHLKKYPYSCDVCQKPFVTRYRLKAHILKEHEGVTRIKDKVCSYCGKGFSNRQVLEAHIRTHTGERPFQCDQCMSCFTQASTLKTHYKAIHLNK